MSRAKIHASATDRWRAHSEASREAGTVRKSINQSPERQATITALRETWGLASDQAVFDRLVDDAAKKLARAKKDA